jgi:opacity protein-like surface antigen
MVLKRLIGLVFAAGLVFSAAAADIVVQIRPPRPVSERRTPRPSRNHVWVSGYHQWNGNGFAWSSGRWEQPPRSHARWVAARWTRHGNRWVLVEGHWR